MPVFAIQAPSGTVLEFFVVFSVILLGPIVFSRLGLPGLIGLLLGGYAIGAHGLGLVSAGNHTVPDLGHLGLLYLMFVAGLELDLRVLKQNRRAAVVFGLLGFSIPFLLGCGVGWSLGWSRPSLLLLGALLSSHTLITYPVLRDAGHGASPAVATAVGATVITDTIALFVLALVAGTQTGSGSPTTIVLEILVGLVVLLVVGLLVLPRVVDAVLRTLGADRVARYVVIVVALLFMAMLAQVFGIEDIVGAFFAGLALNRLVPNEGPSMERVEFFGAAVFIPVFLVSIGLLLDPSVMFTGHTLGIAALLCVAALGGKAIACSLLGPLLHFSRAERAAVYVLSTPQAAATLAVTLIGYEIGLFGTAVVNAVLVLILVSILVASLLAQRVVGWLPSRAGEERPLGEKVVVVTGSAGPSEAAIRAATRLARPDGGHSDVVLVRAATEPRPDQSVLRALEKRIFSHGFDGRVHTEIGDLQSAVARVALTEAPTLVLVDDPSYDAPPGPGSASVSVPVLVVAPDGSGVTRLLGGNGLTEEVQARLGRGERTKISLRRR